MPGSNALAYSYKASVTEKIIYMTWDGRLLRTLTKSPIDFGPRLLNFLAVSNYNITMFLGLNQVYY
jgi:hypothetical protein